MGSCTQEPVRLAKPRGLLLAEAVVASFLLAFAFLAASSIFDTSLRLSNETTQYNTAALIAERKMEEIRALVGVESKEKFAGAIADIIEWEKLDPSYGDAPEYKIQVKMLDILHSEIKRPITSSSSKPARLRPEPGVISPCSTLFTEPDHTGVIERNTSTPPYKFDPSGDYQRNEGFRSYPYSRSLLKSYALVKVVVSFGADYKKSFDLISLIGDPTLSALPYNHDDSGAINPTVKIVRVGGYDDSLAYGDTVGYKIEIKDSKGVPIEDVSVKWSSSGALDVFALDAGGSKVRVRNNSSSNSAGDSTTLTATVVYNGRYAQAEKVIEFK